MSTPADLPPTDQPTAGPNLPVEESPQPTTPARGRIDTQTAVSLGVFLLGFFALFVSIRQAGIMNRQTEILVQQGKAASWPVLEISLNRSFDPAGHITQYQIIVANKGVGPAIIEGVRVSYQGQPATNWSHLAELIGLPDTIPVLYTNDNIGRRVVSPGEQLLMLDLSNTPAFMHWFFQHAHLLEIAICYRSVFDDTWRVTRPGLQTNLEKPIYQSVEGCTLEREEEEFLE